ncbi:MAG: hypothetical protein IPK29_08120 [Betaproteobacteria bacterium]|nr:hypothetical protein [Betaproteobacteria bacterium]
MNPPRRFEFFAVCALATALFFANEFVLTPLVHHALGEPWAALLHILPVLALTIWVARKWYVGRLAEESAALAVATLGEARFRSLTGLSADWFWETDAEHRLQWIAGGQPVLKLFGAERAYGRRIWDVPGLELAGAALDAHLEVLAARAPFHELELRRRCADGGRSPPGFRRAPLRPGRPVRRLSRRRARRPARRGGRRWRARSAWSWRSRPATWRSGTATWPAGACTSATAGSACSASISRAGRWAGCADRVGAPAGPRRRARGFAAP